MVAEPDRLRGDFEQHPSDALGRPIQPANPRLGQGQPGFPGSIAEPASESTLWRRSFSTPITRGVFLILVRKAPAPVRERM